MSGSQVASPVGEVRTGHRQPLRWLALSGVVGPVALVTAFTIPGALRPGYSPIHTAISALGVGPGGWVLNGLGAAVGVLILIFTAVFVLEMRPHIGPVRLGVIGGCLALDGLGFAVAGVFTDAPSTVQLHTIGSMAGTVTSLLAFVLVGLSLRRVPAWQRLGVYSLVAAGVALVLVAGDYALLMPRSPLRPLQLGGLMERLDFGWHVAWYVVFGWRLFRGPPPAKARRHLVG